MSEPQPAAHPHTATTAAANAAANAAAAADAAAPGRRGITEPKPAGTGAAGAAGAGATTAIDVVIGHAGEVVRDDLGFTYVVRTDGSFEVTGTPQQMVR